MYDGVYYRYYSFNTLLQWHFYPYLVLFYGAFLVHFIFLGYYKNNIFQSFPAAHVVSNVDLFFSSSIFSHTIIFHKFFSPSTFFLLICVLLCRVITPFPLFTHERPTIPLSQWRWSCWNHHLLTQSHSLISPRPSHLF